MVGGMKVEDVHTGGLQAGQGGCCLLQHTLPLQAIGINKRIGLCCDGKLFEKEGHWMLVYDIQSVVCPERYM